MKTMLNFIETKYSPHARYAVEKIFAELLLPLPHAEEFWLGNDGTLTFLTPFGAVLRIHLIQKYPLVRNVHILRPVAAIKLDEHTRLDIQPARKTGVTNSNALRAFNDIRADGLYIADIYSGNFIEIPSGSDSILYDQIPVSFDPGRIDIKSESCVVHRTFLDNSARFVDLSPPAGLEDSQDQCFGTLREAFAAAHNPENDNLKPEGIKNFWNTMAQATNDSILVAGWALNEQHQRGDVRETPACAYKYTERLLAESPLFTQPS